MKTRFLLPCGLLLLGALACNTPAGKAPDSAAALTCDQLDGKAYTITISTAGKVDGTEVFTFHQSTAESSECLQYGFGASAYHCSPASDGTLHFTTTMTSDQEGRMDWQGAATANRISGSFVWSKTGQSDIHYTFEGTAKR